MHVSIRVGRVGTAAVDAGQDRQLKGVPYMFMYMYQYLVRLLKLSAGHCVQGQNAALDTTG